MLGGVPIAAKAELAVTRTRPTTNANNIDDLFIIFPRLASKLHAEEFDRSFPPNWNGYLT
jgi:hypothetical protein